MWSLTITLSFLLTSCYGGMVWRSINDKPFKSAKDLLSMKGASQAITTSFKKAGTDLEELAKNLEEEVNEIARLTAKIKHPEIKDMSEALTEAINIQNLMNDQRIELSKLARQTFKKSESILVEFREMVARNQDVESGMRGILKDMRSLLLFSERKLKEAKDNILTLTEKINKVMAILRVFKGLVEAAKTKDQEASRQSNTGNIIKGIFCDIASGVDGYSRANPGDGTSSVIMSLLGGLTRLTGGIVKAFKNPIVGSLLSRALSKINEAIDVVARQKDFMEREVDVIIVWKDAVDAVKNDVFEGEDEVLFDEIQEIIDDGDVEDIYEAFTGMKV